MALDVMGKPEMSPLEMFTELMRLGYVVPSRTDPSRLKEPTAYVSVPTTLVFSTPPIPTAVLERDANAKLGVRPKRDSKGKKRSRR